MNQQGDHLCTDYSSYGSGADPTIDRDASEAECRANYLELVDKLIRYERALEVTHRIAEDDVDIQAGENTFIFNAEIDNGVMYAAEKSDEAVLHKVGESLDLKMVAQSVDGVAGTLL